MFGYLCPGLDALRRQLSFFVLRIIEINDFFVSFASIIALFLIFLTKGMPETPEVRFISSSNPSFSLLPSLGLMISSNGGKLLLLKYLCYYLYWMLCSPSSSDNEVSIFYYFVPIFVTFFIKTLGKQYR